MCACCHQCSAFAGNFNDLVNSGMGSVAMQYGAAQLGGVSQNVRCSCGLAASNLAQLSQKLNVGELKYYFNVDTKYVLNKLKLLLFPFTTKARACQ